MTFSILLRLAWRNLWRNYRRTAIMLLAIVTGVWAMVFMNAMMRGMVDDMIESGIRHLPGHVQIHHPLFRDDPNIVNSIPQFDKDSQNKLPKQQVQIWAERLKVPAVISSERDTRGIQMLGVQPVAEGQMAFSPEQIVQGRWLESADDKGVVIGLKLAEKLETRLGKRIVIMSQDVNNDIAERGFRIVGIYRSDNVALAEEQNVYAGLSTTQTLLKAPGMVSEIAFVGGDYRNVNDVLSAVNRSDYAKAHTAEILPWFQVDSYLGTMMEVMDGITLIWMLVVFLALSFGLVNTLVMAVFERIREIGLMMALGMRPKWVLLQIVFEAALLLVLGLCGGNLLAVATILPFKSGIDLSVVGQGMEMFGANSILYPSLRWQDVLLADTVVVVLGILASVLPARQAARYDPVAALNKT